MADDMQRAGLTGNASMRIPLSGNVQVGGKIMKELRFMPYSEFPETGREETLYIDTDGNTLYYYDGTYIALSGGGGGGGTGDYNELSNKPQINGNVLTGNKTAANLGLQETISDLAAIRSGAASGSTAVQPATLATALATKQDVISDLASIRTGASKGDTAVQPSDMEAALSEKQDTISDLQTIRSWAALGATAVQPADMETALADKQDVISDLDAIRSGATAGNTALQPEDIDMLPTDGSSNPVSSGGTYNFVNSSIATNTAYFIGTFASVAELEAYTGTVTNNDYAFVTSTDSAGNTLYNRYKYNASTQTWSFEYAVNNTAFTAAQWAAIQSGLTASDKMKLDGIEQGANKTVIDSAPTSGSGNAVSSGGVNTALSGKQDTISDLSDIRSGASAGATAVQPSALNDYQTKLSGTNKLDPSYIDYDASHRAVSDSEKSTWNGKQDAISDLSTIRSGAAAGATALQQSDVSSTYSASGIAPVNGTAVSDALGTLNKSSVGGSGKYISAIYEANGKIEATAETMDTVPTSGSTKAVTSGGVQAPLAEVVDAGVKNLFDYDVLGPNATQFGTSVVVNGVRFTMNSDKSVTINRETTSSQDSYVWFRHSDGSAIIVTDLCDDEHVFSGATGASASTYRLFINNINGSGTYKYFGDGEVIGTPQVTPNAAGIFIAASHSPSNLVIKPMLCTAVAYAISKAYVPYALPNPTLTPAAIKAVDEGAKNKFDPASAWDSKTAYGVTITRNGDTYSIASGTTQSGDNNFINMGYQANTNLIPAGDWVLSFDTPQQNVRFQACWNGTLQANASFGNNCFFTVPKNTTDSWFRILLKGSTNMAGTSFKIMLCPRVLWEISQKFVPYCPTNRELYGGELQYEVSDVVDNLNATFVDKTNSRFKIYKYGRFCFADVSLKLNTNNLTGNDTITSTALPEKMRPEFDFYGVAVARDNGVWVSANMLSVPFIIGATNGSVILRTGTGHSSALYITATTVWCASNTIVST